MLAQRLRHRVRLDELVTTEGERGSKSEGWVARLEHEPAEIFAMSAREVVTANNEFGAITHRVTVRYNGLQVKAPTWRVVDEVDGTVFNIKGVLPDFKQRQWLTLLCESGLNNG